MAHEALISDDSSSSSDDDHGDFANVVRASAAVSDSGGTDRSEDSEDSGEDSQDGSPSGALVDLEASEAGMESGSESGSEESFDSAAYAIDGRDYVPRDNRDFPRFMDLPLELRLRIWESFCPDLGPARRVYNLQTIRSERSDISWFPTDGPELSSMTKTSRAVLATHQESREFALRWFPHSFPLNHTDHIVRFNRERDIIMLAKDSQHVRTSERSIFPDDFCKEVVNLATLAWDAGNTQEGFFGEEPDISDKGEADILFDIEYILRYPNLKNVFGVAATGRPRRADLWLETDHCEWTALPGEDSLFIYCWHDLNTPCSREGACRFLENNRLCEHLRPEDDVGSGQDGFLVPPEWEQARERMRSIIKWPFLYFSQPYQKGKFYRWENHVELSKDASNPRGESGLCVVGPSDSSIFGGERAGSEHHDEDEDDDEDDEDDEEDEYESDGIDDEPIPDPETEDENDEQGSGIEDDTLAMELLSNNLVQNGFSPPEEDSDSDESVPRSPSKRQGARRVIVDSDEDEDGDDATGAGELKTRGTKRRRVISDDEDEDGDESDQGPSARPTKRRGKIIDDSDDESGDQGGSLNQQGVILVSDSDDEPAARAQAVDDRSSGEGDFDSDEDESEDDAPARAMSLAERLQMHRQANPVSSASENDSDGTGEGDESDERSGDESEEEENDLVDNMAEDNSEDDEEYEENEDDFYR